ncbi:MAG: hypothetical protein Q9219_001193 [cf. Caloplaca sp. 3 TL-2023]
MTITISPGLDIRIPNHQFIKPDFSVDAQGAIIEANSSSREILINSFQETNTSNIPLLGIPFFSGSYLLVDQERDQFTLWQGNPNTMEQRIVPIEPSAPCTAAASSGPTSALNANSSAAGSSTPNTIKNGAIAGIVVGNVAALVAIVLMLYFYIRRRRRRRMQPELSSGKMNERLSAYQTVFKAELPADKQPPQELPLEKDPPITTAPYEIEGRVSRAELEQLPLVIDGMTSRRSERAELS